MENIYQCCKKKIKLKRIKKILEDDNLKNKWILKRNKMLDNMVDVSEFISLTASFTKLSFIENDS